MKALVLTRDEKRMRMRDGRGRGGKSVARRGTARTVTVFGSKLVP